ncbi:Os11g0206000 [Oryza sativa Japonica Group]|uniref:Os11g0206000 protein n=1 Tax=Oryza sativa subsp. japonica TaxID=39947 RepID=Q0ITZ7_ORYSJ|nr:hypothetical protein OsJ_14267 [Oryza sativa Japonica Group]BAF27818.1 Os11g0206000 [Oryza sativa Japonica Group]|eukprot:NP_001067455.1 Os11g0206000 [Oryza sativa Japonica Group]
MLQICNFLDMNCACFLCFVSAQPPQRRAGEIVSLLQNRLNMNITFKELQGHPASSAGEGDQPVLQAWTAVGDCGRHGGAVLSL